MRYEADTMPEVVLRIRELVRQAGALLGDGADAAPCAAADEAIVVATGLGRSVVHRLSPEALSAVMVMQDHDPQVLELLAQALEIESQISGRNGDIAKASLRTEQALAMRRLLDPDRAN